MVKRRHLIQALGAMVWNGNGSGFVQGRIYQGSLKSFCVPVLNCYSCPGALGACPIGSLQAVLGTNKFSLPYYVLGLMVIFGITLGRFFCGFLCPFGFIQDLLYYLPLPKKRVAKRVHSLLTKVKYLMLGGLVIAFPLLQSLVTGLGDPAFCKYICPAGIIEGGLPLLWKVPYLRSAVGGLFYWKLLLAVVIVCLCMVIYRVFCKYLCPLGAFYGLFHALSFYQLEMEEDLCIHCNRCAKVCKMGITPHQTPNSPECIRCLDCVHVCPTGALHTNVKKSCGGCGRRKQCKG